MHAKQLCSTHPRPNRRRDSGSAAINAALAIVSSALVATLAALYHVLTTGTP